MEISWEKLYGDIDGCVRCGLCRQRHNIVVGTGDKNAAVMLVGEGPGEQEDIKGEPFVGPAGQLLNRMLAAIGVERGEVYIANIVKCRPKNNAVPTEEEAQACLPYLRMQTLLVKPRIIVCLGATAARYILGENTRITRDRGKWVHRKNFWIMATYHPAALLRDSSKKADAWEDMKSLRDKMHEPEANDGK